MSIRPLALLLCMSSIAFAADHRDSPLSTNDPAADINDVYAFMNPSDPTEVILAVTLLPDANVTTKLSDAVEYRVHIESGGAARDVLCTFGGNGSRVSCAGPNGMSASGAVGAVITGANGMRLYSGLRDDPFFFDLDAFNRTKATLRPSFTNPGVNFFSRLNTQAIVLGLKTDRLLGGSSPVLKVGSSTKRVSGHGISGGISGAWHDVNNTGHGFYIQVVNSPSGPPRFLVTWDVYSPAQQQLYLVGEGAFSGNSVTVDLVSTAGGRFPPGFPGDVIQRLPWGTITFNFTDCNRGTATYNSTRPGYGSGTIDITRLTSIAGLGCTFLASGQIDRMGRPGINTVLVDLLSSTGKKDIYNRLETPAEWAAQFTAHFQGNIAALDTLDGVTGNAVLPPAPLAGVLVDDRLIIDVSKPGCGPYLAVELGIPSCGGRTLARDVIDDSLGALVGPGVSDNVANDSAFLTTFPFVGAPHQ